MNTRHNSARGLLLGALALMLVSLATLPAAEAHTTHCGGGGTSGGLCLIVCDQTHLLFGGWHACTYNASSCSFDLLGRCLYLP